MKWHGIGCWGGTLFERLVLGLVGGRNLNANQNKCTRSFARVPLSHNCRFVLFEMGVWEIVKLHFAGSRHVSASEWWMKSHVMVWRYEIYYALCDSEWNYNWVSLVWLQADSSRTVGSFSSSTRLMRVTEICVGFDSQLQKVGLLKIVPDFRERSSWIREISRDISLSI